MPVASLLLPFVSSRRQNRIRRDRVVQCSVYNSGSLHQLLNLLLREKEGEGEGEEEGGGKDRFWEIDIPPCIPLYPAQIQPASLILILILPAMSIPPARIIMYVVRSICCSSLSSLVRLSLRRHPRALHRSSLHRTHSHSSVPHSPISEIASPGRE